VWRWNLSLRLSRESALARYPIGATACVVERCIGIADRFLPSLVRHHGNTLFFIAQPASSIPPGSAARFKSDGTTAGTTQVNGHEL
jgi:hypothetical protein